MFHFLNTCCHNQKNLGLYRLQANKASFPHLHEYWPNTGDSWLNEEGVYCSQQLQEAEGEPVACKACFPRHSVKRVRCHLHVTLNETPTLDKDTKSFLMRCKQKYSLSEERAVKYWTKSQVFFSFKGKLPVPGKAVDWTDSKVQSRAKRKFVSYPQACRSRKFTGKRSPPFTSSGLCTGRQRGLP